MVFLDLKKDADLVGHKTLLTLFSGHESIQNPCTLWQFSGHDFYIYIFLNLLNLLKVTVDFSIFFHDQRIAIVCMGFVSICSMDQATENRLLVNMITITNLDKR